MFFTNRYVQAIEVVVEAPDVKLCGQILGQLPAAIGELSVAKNA
jgi:hypothetical protein